MPLMRHQCAKDVPCHGTNRECRARLGSQCRDTTQEGSHLHGHSELAAADRVPVLLDALPLLALQQIRVVADLAQNVNARQRVLAVLHFTSIALGHPKKLLAMYNMCLCCVS